MSTRTTDRKYLRWYTRRGATCHGDWGWLQDRFLPAVKRFQAAAKNAADKALLSDAYYRVGDIFDFMDAPLEALKHYKLSIKADPEHPGAYREAGSMLERMGKYEQARRYLSRSLELWPSDDCARVDLEFVERELEYVAQHPDGEDYAVLYEPGDKDWAMDELLAQGKFSRVLSELDTPVKAEDRRRRACAHGGMRDTRAFIAEWDKIAEMEGPIEFRPADWFYMTDRVWHNTAFWLALRRLTGRLRYGWWGLDESLRTSVVPSPKRGRHGSKAEIERCRRRFALTIE